jgi:hypothetical protein
MTSTVPVEEVVMPVEVLKLTDTWHPVWEATCRELLSTVTTQNQAHWVCIVLSCGHNYSPTLLATVS